MARLLALALVLMPMADAIFKRGGWHLAAGAARFQQPVAVIPNTIVPMPPDYEDYTRGRHPLPVFPSGTAIPGEREKLADCPGKNLPCFDPSDPVGSAEVWMNGTMDDPVAARCAPGDKAVGHVFYNVWVPELVPFVLPPGTPGRRDTAVIVAPGGGFLELAWEVEGISAAQWLNSIGISAFVLKYRVPNEEPALLDAQRALSLVRSKADGYGLNASRVGFMGCSAGGDLGIRLATAVQRSYKRIDAVDDVSFRPDFLLTLYPKIPAETDQFAYSLLPPMFVAFSEDDPCPPPARTREMVDFARSLTNSTITMYAFPDGGHGWQDSDYWLAVKGMSPDRWRGYAEDWMRGLGAL